MTIGELRKHLDNYPDEMPCACALWLPKDVKETAEVHELPEPSSEIIESVLFDAEYWHERNHGINRGQIAAYIRVQQLAVEGK